jgi:spore coat protein SA
MAHIYHFLDEAESFSEFSGGAISRWVANVLKDRKESVVCRTFDASWGFADDRVFTLPNWGLCDQIHPLLWRSPWAVQKPFYRRVLFPLLERLKSGDILYIHNRPECAEVLAEPAKLRGIGVVLHMHNSLLHPRSRKHIPALRDIPVVFCSEFLRNEVTAAFPNHFQKTHVVYNGADSNMFKAEFRTQRFPPKIVYTGRLVPFKGVHVLMDAMRILGSEGVSATCTIVGGSAFGKCKPTRYVQELERTRPGNTELVGYKAGKEFASILRQADIFCCPSIWNDPFPLAPLEAMAAGLPVVASRTGGIPEALAFGGGILVPPNDADALARALKRLIEDAPYRNRLGKEAAEASRGHFVWDSVRSQYDSVIGGLVS